MRIVCENLSYSYGTDKKTKKDALKNISLTIEEGDFLGIIGHTGSGKSTFVQHLNGILSVQSGNLQVGEYNLSEKKKTLKKKLKQLRSKVGFVFQYPEYQLFADTVYSDIAFGIKNFYPEMTDVETAYAVKYAMDTVGLDYNEYKNKSPFELSGGQKRRVAIAGVIVTKPEVLVLDEPVAGLDPKGKRELMALLHNLQNSFCKTIIIVSHDMNEVSENCNKVAVFDNGRLIKCGTPKEIYGNVDEIINLRLDVPDTAYLTQKLKEKGIELNTDYSLDDFVESVVNKYKELKNK